MYLDELADAFGAVVAEKRLQSLHALGRQQLVPITGHRVHREKHLHAAHFTQTHYSTYLCASIHIVSMSFNDPSLLTLNFVEEVFEQITQFFLMIRDRSTFVNAKFTRNLKISLQIKEVEP